jgi:hypothetical protein
MEWPICETTENLIKQVKRLNVELKDPELPKPRQYEVESLLYLIKAALNSRIQKVS